MSHQRKSRHYNCRVAANAGIASSKNLEVKAKSGVLNNIYKVGDDYDDYDDYDDDDCCHDNNR